MQENDNALIDGLFALSLEIEGLLALIMRREDCVASEVYAMLSDKVASLQTGVSGLCEPREPRASERSESREAARERAFIESMPSLPGLMDPEESEAEAMESEAISAQDDACALLGIDEAAKGEAIAGAALYEEAEDAEVIPGLAAEPQADDEPSQEPEPQSQSAPEPAAEAAVEVEEVAHKERHMPGDLRRMFTVNDKFRFRRELFGNSDTEFSDALHLVEAMAELAEAEDYFYNDLGWDREEPVVSEFMEVITRYFS